MFSHMIHVIEEWLPENIHDQPHPLAYRVIIESFCPTTFWMFSYNTMDLQKLAKVNMMINENEIRLIHASNRFQTFAKQSLKYRAVLLIS